MAWGIGFVVGFGSVLLGGSGQMNGIMCALVALLSIFCGKIGAGMAILPGYLHGEYVKQGANEQEADAQVKVDLQKVKFSDYVSAAQKTLEPIDIVFGEYLRALMTADFDLVPYDRLGYRIVEAPVVVTRERPFPRVGAGDVRHVAQDTAAIWYRTYLLRYYDRVGAQVDANFDAAAQSAEHENPFEEARS